MIASDIIREIRHLLAEGSLSQRVIALRMGVSRGTVGSIAQGKRRDYPLRDYRKSPELVSPAGRPSRCTRCGSMVQMPCLACYIRRWKRRKSIVCGRTRDCDGF
jgi:hypothetical protein